MSLDQKERRPGTHSHPHSHSHSQPILEMAQEERYLHEKVKDERYHNEKVKRKKAETNGKFFFFLFFSAASMSVRWQL